MEPDHPQQQLSRSPTTGRIRTTGAVAAGAAVATHPEQVQQQERLQYLLRPNGQPVAPTSGCKEPVLISVYDLHWSNRITRLVGMAAYHTGLELHGIEIAFGDSGVFTMAPRDATAMEGSSGLSYRKSIPLGTTNYTREDALLISGQLGRGEFAGSTYSLMRRNCNHFSAALGRLLCPRSRFPARINLLARVGVRLPLVERSVQRFAEAADSDGDSDDRADDDGGCSGADGSNRKKHQRRGLAELSVNSSVSSSAVRQRNKKSGKKE